MSGSTAALTDRLRSTGDLAGESDRAVTGATAVDIDVSEELLQALPLHLVVVLGLGLAPLGPVVAVACGILVDALPVRMTAIPAVTAVTGTSVW